MVDDRYEPETTDVVRDEGVTIAFLDGYVAQFDLVTLRRMCPCATCRGLRDQGEPVIRSGHEPYDDCGPDKLCDEQEPGYSS